MHIYTLLHIKISSINTKPLNLWPPKFGFSAGNMIITPQKIAHTKIISTPPLNTLRTGLLNCLNARSRGLTFRHRAICI